MGANNNYQADTVFQTSIDAALEVYGFNSGRPEPMGAKITGVAYLASDCPIRAVYRQEHISPQDPSIQSESVFFTSGQGKGSSVVMNGSEVYMAYMGNGKDNTSEPIDLSSEDQDVVSTVLQAYIERAYEFMEIGEHDAHAISKLLNTSDIYDPADIDTLEGEEDSTEEDVEEYTLFGRLRRLIG